MGYMCIFIYICEFTSNIYKYKTNTFNVLLLNINDFYSLIKLVCLYLQSPTPIKCHSPIMATYFREPIDLKHPTLSTTALVYFQSISRIRIQQDQRSPKLTLKEKQ